MYSEEYIKCTLEYTKCRGNTQNVPKKFAQNTKIVLKKGIDNGNKQSEYIIISSRGDSIYAPQAVKIM